ncbi:hypothetical protein ACEPPZ_16840 [Paracoccus yeei]|uniref:hypothetical protein n=1 Tax=Paracoccus yeei TaxID=147645 RepID=UPI0037D0FE5F
MSPFDICTSNWHRHAASTRSSARTQGPLPPAAQNAAPAPRAATMPATEIWFGVTDVPASRRVIRAAQPDWRLARGLRLDRSAIPYPTFQK